MRGPSRGLGPHEHCQSVRAPNADGQGSMRSTQSSRQPPRLTRKALCLLLLLEHRGVCGQCPDGWSPSPTGKCFRLAPEPYDLRGDVLPSFSECPAICGPEASLACLNSTDDISFVAENLLCRGSPETWQIPWTLDTTLPDPGVCIAAFTGAYSVAEDREYLFRAGTPHNRNYDLVNKRRWRCGRDASSYNASALFPNELLDPDWRISSYTSYTWTKNARRTRGAARVEHLYSTVGPSRLSWVWRPTHRHREEWYGHRGNVTMVLRGYEMTEPNWRASDTQEMNLLQPHAPCLCEHVRGATDGGGELQALLERSASEGTAWQVPRGCAGFRCMHPWLYRFVAIMASLPIVLAICCTCCVKRNTFTVQQPVHRARNGHHPQHPHQAHAGSTTSHAGSTTSHVSVDIEFAEYVNPLIAAMSAQYWQRTRVSGTLVLLGWVLLSVAFFASQTSNVLIWRHKVLGSHMYYLALLPWGVTVLVLAVRPVDHRIILALRILFTLFCLFFSLTSFLTASGALRWRPYTNLFLYYESEHAQDWDSTTARRIGVGRFVGYLVSGLLLALAVWAVAPRCFRLGCSRRASARMTPRVQLGRVWIAARLAQLVVALLSVAELLDNMHPTSSLDATLYWRMVQTIVRCMFSGRWYAWSWGGLGPDGDQAGAWFWQPTAECHVLHYPDWDIYLPVRVESPQLARLVYATSATLCLLMSTQTNRTRVIRTLHRLLAPSDSRATAASLAGLLGSAQPAQAFKRAKESLRALPLSSFTASIFEAADRPATCQGFMGAIDAFVCHSWRDDAASKVHQLNQWFAAQESRQTTEGSGADVEAPTEPLIWIDIACLNQEQGSIVIGTMCLPFFILASKEFVGLVGPSFPNRLWCVMEVFFVVELRANHTKPLTFLDIGAEPEDDNTAQQGTRFSAFEARLAQCEVQLDRDHLLAIIESSFGDLRRFDRIVRLL